MPEALTPLEREKGSAYTYLQLAQLGELKKFDFTEFLYESMYKSYHKNSFVLNLYTIKAFSHFFHIGMEKNKMLAVINFREFPDESYILFDEEEEESRLYQTLTSEDIIKFGYYLGQIFFKLDQKLGFSLPD